MDQRGKLDPKSRQCIFLGYGDDEFGYQLSDLINKKVIRGRDIVFMEEKTIVIWETKNKSPVTESSQVDARPNREEIDSIEIESKLVGWLNTQQIENQLKNKGNWTNEETKPNRTRKSKKNWLRRMEAKDMP